MANPRDKPHVLEWRKQTLCLLGITDDDYFYHDYNDGDLHNMLVDVVEDSEVLIECHEEELDEIFMSAPDKKQASAKNMSKVQVTDKVAGESEVAKRSRDDNAADVNPQKRFRHHQPRHTAQDSALAKLELAISRAEHRGHQPTGPCQYSMGVCNGEPSG